MAKTTVFLTIEPQWGTQSWNREKLQGIKVTNTTQSRPKKPLGPVVKLTLDIPDAAFKPLAPEVVISIPEEALDYEPVVTVELPESACD